MNITKIEWCDATLNPVVGCTFGCEFCYARGINHRFGFVPEFERPQFFPERMKGFERKKPMSVFVDSMSDIADWKEEWMHEVMNACYENPQHQYLFLTKRPDCYFDIVEYLEGTEAPEPKNDEYPGIWLGASAGTNDLLISAYDSPATWISIEPICEEISTDYFSTDLWDGSEVPRWLWVVVGAESGNRKDRIVPKREWIDDLAKECAFWKTPIFMKDSLIPIIGEENMKREFPKGLSK